MTLVSGINLKRTDTTLDLSQKAEKRCRFGSFYPFLKFAVRYSSIFRHFRRLENFSIFFGTGAHVTPRA